jgi:hypothetical protein
MGTLAPHQIFRLMAPAHEVGTAPPVDASALERHRSLNKVSEPLTKETLKFLVKKGRSAQPLSIRT